MTSSGADACTLPLRTVTKENLLPVIAIPITNDVSNIDLTVVEVIKVALPNSLERKDTTVVAETQGSPSKEGWVTVTTKKGR